MIFRKRSTPPLPYDPATQEPVIRASICTGERAAGFRDKTTGRFTEVMLVQSEADVSAFCAMYGLTQIKTEY